MKILFYSPYIPDHFGGGEKHLLDIATTLASKLASKHEVFVAVPDDLFLSGNMKEDDLQSQLLDQDKSFEESELCIAKSDNNINNNVGEKKQQVSTSILSSELIIKKIQKKYEKFLNYSLDNITFIPSKLFNGSVFEKLKETKKYDYLYYATDGSFFLSAAKTNNLHIQIPFTNKLNIWEKIKLSTWKIKNTNSEFTKNVVEKSWNIKVDFVHNPLVSLDEIKPGVKKEKIILNVGRFFKQLHSKRQDILVEFFKKLIDDNKKDLSGWKLVLIGSVEDKKYLAKIKNLAKGYPIEIKNNISREELIKYYQKAAIYWHATGFGVDESINPEKVEHFGITTIEAMAAGCVPVVINKGGQKEILGAEGTSGLSGLNTSIKTNVKNNLGELLWSTEKECLDITKKIILNNEEYKKFQALSLNRVKKFSKQVFQKTVWEMFK